MSVLEDLTGATTSELSDELIFQIASASSPEQRKYAADLFRYFAKQLEFEILSARAAEHGRSTASVAGHDYRRDARTGRSAHDPAVG